MENINMLIAEKLGEFVMGRLFQNKAHLGNNGDGITTSEIMARLEEIRSIDNYEYAIENTSSYRELMKRCAGSVNFSSDEIVEIGKLVKEAVRLNGIDTNNTYWDVLSFAAKRMDKIMEHNSKDSEIYEKALKYKECLNLNRVPLYYKPFACAIACGYPHVMLRIDTFDSKTIYKVSRNGEVLVDRLPKTEDMNDQSVLCKLIDGKYYIGETYFSAGYMLIANRGGNNNSIGIESCINDETDIYYTWQKTAKLVANLLYNNNLTFDDVKQHHYYSGKNCPQTMRMNGMWPYFMELVKVEYEAIELMKEGYKFELLVDSPNVNKLGRILNSSNEVVKCVIKITKDNQETKLEYNVDLS